MKRLQVQQELEAGQIDCAKANEEGKAEGAGKKDQRKQGGIPDTVRKMLTRKKKRSKNGAVQNTVKGSTTVEEKRTY